MTAQKSILIVEDDRQVAALVSIALRSFDVDISHVDNGHDALSFMEHNEPDLILLDISMPSMNGWQFMEMLYEQTGRTDFPVIVLTAHTDAYNRVTGQLQGVRAYLNKPIMPDKLRAVIARELALPH